MARDRICRPPGHAGSSRQLRQNVHAYSPVSAITKASPQPRRPRDDRGPARCWWTTAYRAGDGSARSNIGSAGLIAQHKVVFRGRRAPGAGRDETATVCGIGHRVRDSHLRLCSNVTSDCLGPVPGLVLGAAAAREFRVHPGEYRKAKVVGFAMGSWSRGAFSYGLAAALTVSKRSEWGAAFRKPSPATRGRRGCLESSTGRCSLASSCWPRRQGAKGRRQP